jgi:hypothetical protein
MKTGSNSFIILLDELARDVHAKEELLHYAKGCAAMGSREYYRSLVEAFENG